MLKLSGYFMSLADTREFTKLLGVDVSSAKDEELEYLLNTWLFENNMHHILAAFTFPFEQTFDSVDEVGTTFIANEAIQEFSSAEPKMEETATVMKVKEWI
ncbi:hypothetical protein FA95DRAFT_1680857, partial [Auriscalpium vulgare]